MSASEHWMDLDDCPIHGRTLADYLEDDMVRDRKLTRDLHDEFERFTKGATAVDLGELSRDWLSWTELCTGQTLEVPLLLASHYGKRSVEGEVLELRVERGTSPGVYKCRAFVAWSWERQV